MMNKDSDPADRRLILGVLGSFLVIFFIFSVLPMGLDFSRIPGTFEDTRFNNYILEHHYRWVKGLEPSLLTLPMFAPYQYTLFFSDAHFGSAPFYIAFRFLGLNRETALQAFLMLWDGLNFLAAAFVLFRAKLKTLPIAIGAFLFTYALPVLARETHFQLKYRFLIPLALYFLAYFLKEKQLRKLTAFLAILVAQFIFSIYLGFMLSILSAAIFLVYVVSNIGFSSVSFRRFLGSWQPTFASDRFLHFGIWIGLGVVLALLFIPYSVISSRYGFDKPEWEMLAMLPRPASFLISDSHSLWGPLGKQITDMDSYRGEHQLLIGAVPIFILLLGYFVKLDISDRQTSFLFSVGTLLVLILVIEISGHSLYQILWRIPGFSSIRAVSRVILVLLWPVSYGVAVILDAMLRKTDSQIRMGRLVWVFFLLALIEVGMYNRPIISKAKIEQRVGILRSEMKNGLQGADRYVYYAIPAEETDGSKWLKFEIDAMLASQSLGVETLNGYSGNFPMGYGTPPTCDALAGRIAGYTARYPSIDPEIAMKLDNILIVGDINCANN